METPSYVQVGTKRRVCVVNFNLARRPRSTRDPLPNPTRYFEVLYNPDPNPNLWGPGFEVGTGSSGESCHTCQTSLRNEFCVYI